MMFATPYLNLPPEKPALVRAGDIRGLPSIERMQERLEKNVAVNPASLMPMFCPKATATPYRYWRLYKTNGAVGGNGVTEIEWHDVSGNTGVTSGMISNSGTWTSFSATAIVDGNTAAVAFYADSAGVGSFVTVDFAGSPKALNKVRINTNLTNCFITFKIQYSSDNSTYFDTSITAWDISGAAGWQQQTF